MNFNNIIQRVIGIITKPAGEWKKIKGEKSTIAEMFTNYAIILAAIPAIAGFIGYSAIGRSFMGFTVRMPLGRAIMWSILMYIFSLLGVYLLGFIIDFLAPNFGAKKDMVISTKIAVYSMTPSWIAGVFFLIPALAILSFIAGLYALYLLYMGIKDLKSPEGDKTTPYFVVTIIAYIVIAFVISFMVSTIAFGSARAFM